jgi:hypothetical protein
MKSIRSGKYTESAKREAFDLHVFKNARTSRVFLYPLGFTIINVEGRSLSSW